jgi:hypothetical protein
MKYLLYILITMALLNSLLLGCHNISATPPIDHKSTDSTLPTNCSTLAQVVEQQGRLVPVDKTTPDALWVEFSVKKSDDPNEHKIDCYYKKVR